MEIVFSESQVVEQVYTEVQQRFIGMSDLAHGWEHVGRVYKLALHIARQEGADIFIVGMAALLHDLGRSVQHNETQHHADLSAELARDLLQYHHVPIEKQQAILHAIIAHSFSRGIQPRTLEAQVVRDADRLDGLGAIGIMRWAVTGALRRAPKMKLYHPDDPFDERHEPDDKQYRLDHFYTKLLKLSETMTTEAGRMLALQRTRFMHTYLREFRKELELL
jgi:uncharacterized protein